MHPIDWIYKLAIVAVMGLCVWGMLPVWHNVCVISDHAASISARADAVASDPAIPSILHNADAISDNTRQMSDKVTAEFMEPAKKTAWWEATGKFLIPLIAKGVL